MKIHEIITEGLWDLLFGKSKVDVDNPRSVKEIEVDLQNKDLSIREKLMLQSELKGAMSKRLTQPKRNREASRTGVRPEK